jgi:NAD(P)-dependent dehydrogenase (short-subunit alcohol dehydrogenase family)
VTLERRLRFCVIAAGVVDANFRKFPHFEPIKGWMETTLPARRLEVPSDVAGAIAFNASKRAACMKGDTIHVTGGGD